MEDTPIMKSLRIIIPVLDTLAFIALEYILICCGYAFQMNFTASLILKLITGYVSLRCFFNIRKAVLGTKRRKFLVELLFAVAIWIVSCLAIYFIMKQFGYLDIATVLKQMT